MIRATQVLRIQGQPIFSAFLLFPLGGALHVLQPLRRLLVHLAALILVHLLPGLALRLGPSAGDAGVIGELADADTGVLAAHGTGHRCAIDWISVRQRGVANAQFSLQDRAFQLNGQLKLHYKNHIHKC